METSRYLLVQVVDFRNKLYRPENARIFICGNVTIDEVISSISKTETKIRSKPKLPTFVRPWKDTLPPLKTTVIKTVIPSEDEGFADVYIAWRGPYYFEEPRKYKAVSIIMRYMRNIVNLNDFHAESMSYYEEETVASGQYVMFGKVPVDKADSVYTLFHTLLKSITSSK